MSVLEPLVVDSNRRRPADDEAVARFLAALTDEVAHGLIVCDSDGCLRFANRSARAELARGKALRLVDGVINVAAGPQTPLQSALRDASLRARRRMFAVGSGGERLMALTMPLRVNALEGAYETAKALPAGGSLVLVMLGRRGTCSALGIEMLAMLHGLTLAERGVLRALLDGDVPNRIALSHGIAVSTVRTHVKSIRDKFGVRSVEGLFIRAAEVPPVTAALRCCDGDSAAANSADQPRRPAPRHALAAAA